MDNLKRYAELQAMYYLSLDAAKAAMNQKGEDSQDYLVAAGLALDYKGQLIKIDQTLNYDDRLELQKRLLLSNRVYPLENQ